MTGFNVKSANSVSIVTTLIDAALAFTRGRRKSGLVLLGAAALSSKVPGVGTAVSLFLRLLRWFR